MQVFATSDLPPRQRFDAWREVITSQFVPLRPESAAPEPFFGDIHAVALGSLSLSCIRGGGQVVHRGAREIARTTADVYFLNLQVDGSGGFAHGGDACRTLPGDLFLVDAFHAFRLHCERPIQHACLAIPAPLVRPRLARPDLAAGTVLSRPSGTAGLLADYLLAASRRAAEAPVPAQLHVDAHLLELLIHALNERHIEAPQPRQAIRAALLDRARRIIDRQYGDPDLDPATLALQLRVSVRYLHGLFREEGESVMRNVYRRRIEAASAALRDPSQRHRSITDVAFACGFRDSSHFGRVFAAELDLTPSEWRQRSLS